jgi:hypothetical protein
MNAKPAVLLLTGLLFACAPPPPLAPPAPPPAPAPAPAASAPAPAPVDRFVSIQGARCAELLALQPDDRVEASMFYMGYTARRYGVRTVNVGMIPTMVRLASDYCAAAPNRTVASVFSNVYRNTRGRRGAAARDALTYSVR